MNFLLHLHTSVFGKTFHSSVSLGRQIFTTYTSTSVSLWRGISFICIFGEANEFSSLQLLHLHLSLFGVRFHSSVSLDRQMNFHLYNFYIYICLFMERHFIHPSLWRHKWILIFTTSVYIYICLSLKSMYKIYWNIHSLPHLHTSQNTRLLHHRSFVQINTQFSWDIFFVLCYMWIREMHYITIFLNFIHFYRDGELQKAVYDVLGSKSYYY